LLSVWTVGVFLGTGLLVHYQMSAAATPGAAPDQWPAAAKISRDKDRVTLVMSVHPQCPCSMASMHELGALLGRTRGQVKAYVLFVAPKNAPRDWVEAGLWRAAHAIANLNVEVDSDGVSSNALGATTSGQVVVYSTAGQRLFSGGITDGRGHEGDNPGADAVLAILLQQKPMTEHTPVYGCALGGQCAVGKKQ
jgi:hypothetical protein